MASLFLLGACGDKDINFVNVVVPPIRVATTLTLADSTQNQTGIAGAALAKPISVRVFDQFGIALPAAVVTWSVVGDGGSVPQAFTVTDANGDASIVWTLGTAAGVDSLRATIASGDSVLVTATVTAGPFSVLALVSGDGQNVPAGSATVPMIVKAVDVNGNAVAGVAIVWTTTGGGTLSATTGTTDANGMAQVSLTTNAIAGPYTVVATSGASTVTFLGNGQ
jgi:hypothetical protein